MIRAALLALALAAPAMAQTLPVFDESKGFDIIGFVDGEDGLLVRNAEASFFCKVEEGKGKRFLVLSRCQPIVGPKAAGAAMQAAMKAEPDEDALLEALDAMPPEAFIPAVAKTLREMGCTINIGDSGEEAFVAALAPNVAAVAGYTVPLTTKAVDEIGEITEDAGEMMVEQGTVIVDRNAGTATLVDCE